MLHGYQSADRVKQLLEAADLFICTSHDEGLGLPLLEAQYAGLPIIAPDDAIFREVLGESGIFINPADPASAAERIAAALSAPDWRACYVALAEQNLARWNALASGDRDTVINLIAGLAGTYALTPSQADSDVAASVRKRLSSPKQDPFLQARPPRGIWMGCGSSPPAPSWSCTIRITSRTCRPGASWSSTPGISTCSSTCSLSSPASSSPASISAVSTTAASIGRFLWRRLARIYPLHLATLAFYVALAVRASFRRRPDRQSRPLSAFRSAGAVPAAARVRRRAADIQLPELVAVGGDVLLSAVPACRPTVRAAGRRSSRSLS